MNDNSIGDFANSQSHSLSVLQLLQHREQDLITGPNVKGVNIGKRIAAGNLKKSTMLFLKPKAAKTNTIA